MLNKEQQRELAYVVKIDDIIPIIGSDNCECAVVGGWHVMVKKDTFKTGDLAIYFEIDSLVDLSNPAFTFMSKYHGKVKTQKYTFGGKNPGFYSQGLLVHPSDLCFDVEIVSPDFDNYLIDKDGKKHYVNDESRFLTQILKVKYYDPEDQRRKSNSKEKQPEMPKFFHSGIGRKMMRVKWLKKILIKLFGKKKKKKNWPEWVAKTDEERVQNEPWIIKEEDYWVATEKIDGTSTTISVRKNKKKFDSYICSRNVVFDKPDKNCFYDTNVYVEMAEKYHLVEFLIDYLNNHKDIEWATIQGETYGDGIQKRDYSLKEHKFAGFNFIDSINGRWNSPEAKALAEKYEIPWVPILDEHFVMPETVDELLEIATNKSVIDGLPREGLVFRSKDGKKSFKAVSNEFLTKYHN